ncbi:MAG: CDP-diacylglycerol--glycerol-3-phosphate 3-phosphatidyltransferase [Candidatus Methylacidiphilales bacterium]
MNVPNQLTVLRLLLCGVFVAILEVDGVWRGTAAFVVFVLAALTDCLDGHLARKWNLVTDLGRLLDPLADKILVSIAYIALVREGTAALWIVAIIISREFLITGLRTLAAAKGIILSAERIGKHKTISQMVTVIVGLLLMALGDLGWRSDWVSQADRLLLQPLLWITVAITLYSGCAYYFKNRHLIDSKCDSK